MKTIFVKTIQLHYLTLSLFFIFQFVITSGIKGQNPKVKAIYDESTNKITIINSSGNNIYLFNKNYEKDDKNKKKKEEWKELIGIIKSFGEPGTQGGTTKLTAITGWCGLRNDMVIKKGTWEISNCEGKDEIIYYVINKYIEENAVLEYGGRITIEIKNIEPVIQEPIKKEEIVTAKEIKTTNTPVVSKKEDEIVPKNKAEKEDLPQKVEQAQKNNEDKAKVYFPQYAYRVMELEKESGTYLDKTLDANEKNALTRKKQQCRSLLDEMNKDLSDFSTISPEYKELSVYIGILEKLETEIIKKLSNISGQQIDEMRIDYKNEVLSVFAGDSLLFYSIYNVIEEKEKKSVFFRWRGKDSILANIHILENNYDDLKNKSDIFIKREKEKYRDAVDKEVVGDLTKNIPGFYKKTDELKRRLDEIEVPYLLFGLVILVLIMVVSGLLFYIKVFLKNEKLKKIEEEQNKEENFGLIPFDEDEEITYDSGLEHLRSEIGKEYYEIDMCKFFDDTAIQYVYFNKKCIKDIYRFFNNYSRSYKNDTETGCFIVGVWEYAEGSNGKKYNISLESIIEPSDDAIHGEYELNFGAEIGISLESVIMNLREATNREYVHTAWMHSHPGLGLFLSSHDLVAQSQLAYRDNPNRMLAIVIDTNSPDFDVAFFSPKLDGTMNNYDINDHSKNTNQNISFKKLYKWAEDSVQVNDERKDYYELNVKTKYPKVDTVSFNEEAIFAIDTQLASNTTGLLGYFYGQELYGRSLNNRVVIIDEFYLLSENKNHADPISCLLIEHDFSYEHLIKKYMPIVKRFDFFTVYQPIKNRMYVIVKNDNNKFSDDVNGITSILLDEMKNNIIKNK